MEETDSITSDPTTSQIRKLNYFHFLEEMNKLSDLSMNLNNLREDPSIISEIDILLNDISENIIPISIKMSFGKKSMFVITIFNTFVRICAIDQTDLLISRECFQLIFDQLSYLMWDIQRHDDYESCVDHLMDSILTNLSKDEIDLQCFERIFPKEISSEMKGIQSSFLNKSISILLPHDEESSQINFPRLMCEYLIHLHQLLTTVVIQSEYQFESCHTSLMSSILINLHNCFMEREKDLSLIQYEFLSFILCLICDLTDKVQLIPMFVQCGYVEKVLQWFEREIFLSHIDQFGSSLFTIVHNLSRDSLGLKQLRKEEAFNIIIKSKNLVFQRNDEQLTQIFGSAFIDLATNDETSEENKTFILDTTRNLYQICKKAGQSKDFRAEEGFHLSELVELLHRAFSNTYVIKHFLQNPTSIKYFSELLLQIYGILLDREADHLEKRAAQYLLKILLQISSYPEYQKELIENNQFCIIIESLANRTKQDDAKRIWSNLQQHISPDKISKEKVPMIYISYDWSNQQFAKEFLRDLRKKISIPIWIDYEHMELSDDMWTLISSKITLATIIIVLVSTDYGETTEKFQELAFIISHHRNNSIIVVKVEPNLNLNRSWMKDLLKDKTLIPFDNRMTIITSRVRDQIGITKKSFFKCFSRQNKSSSSNIPLESINAAPVSDTIIDCSSGVIIPTYSIVSSLTTQTGTTDLSTWV